MSQSWLNVPNAPFPHASDSASSLQSLMDDLLSWRSRPFGVIPLMFFTSMQNSCFQFLTVLWHTLSACQLAFFCSYEPSEVNSIKSVNVYFISWFQCSMVTLSLWVDRMLRQQRCVVTEATYLLVARKRGKAGKREEGERGGWEHKNSYKE